MSFAGAITARQFSATIKTGKGKWLPAQAKHSLESFLDGPTFERFRALKGKNRYGRLFLASGAGPRIRRRGS